MSTRNLAVAVPEDVFATYARDVLEIFNASHDFFALHLVTATHAFLLATEGLDVAGAPALERGIEAMPIDVDFEHYVKFAFALEELGGMLDDASYRKTAEVVRRNLPSAETGVQQVEQALAQRGAEGASRQGI